MRKPALPENHFDEHLVNSSCNSFGTSLEPSSTLFSREGMDPAFIATNDAPLQRTITNRARVSGSLQLRAAPFASALWGWKALPLVGPRHRTHLRWFGSEARSSAYTAYVEDVRYTSCAHG